MNRYILGLQRLSIDFSSSELKPQYSITCRDAVRDAPAVECDRFLHRLRALGGRVHHRDDELVGEIGKLVVCPGPEMDNVTRRDLNRLVVGHERRFARVNEVQFFFGVSVHRILVTRLKSHHLETERYLTHQFGFHLSVRSQLLSYVSDINLIHVFFTVSGHIRLRYYRKRGTAKRQL